MYNTIDTQINNESYARDMIVASSGIIYSTCKNKISCGGSQHWFENAFGLVVF